MMLILLPGTYEVSAQESFRLPPKMVGPPVAYLEKMKVSDTSRPLSQAEKHELCRLFAKAYVISVRKHGQDYLLQTSAPIYRLLVTNFPDISAREGEGGSVIFLAAIMKFFNASPEYKVDVVKVLREGITPENCQH